MAAKKVSAKPNAAVLTPDRETSSSDKDHTSLRLWLRLLTCTTIIENEVRGKLREEFETTLPRFDLMAQLERAPKGLKMGELSKRMMVTGGNVTGITDLLEKEGLVERAADPNDRRAWLVRLTPAGRRGFAAMAAEHERWIVESFDALSGREMATMAALLARLKAHVRSLEERDA